MAGPHPGGGGAVELEAARHGGGREVGGVCGRGDQRCTGGRLVLGRVKRADGDGVARRRLQVAEGEAGAGGLADLDGASEDLVAHNTHVVGAGRPPKAQLGGRGTRQAQARRGRGRREVRNAGGGVLGAGRQAQGPHCRHGNGKPPGGPRRAGRGGGGRPSLRVVHGVASLCVVAARGSMRGTAAQPHARPSGRIESKARATRTASSVPRRAARDSAPMAQDQGVTRRAGQRCASHPVLFSLSLLRLLTLSSLQGKHGPAVRRSPRTLRTAAGVVWA